MTEQLEQRSPEWFEARKGRITASIVGAILGHAPYMTRADALRSMVRATLGAESEFTGNVATEYGKFHEDGALMEYRMETSSDVDAVGFVAKEDWAGFSPDGIVKGLKRGLEIKCPFSLRKGTTPEKGFKSIFSEELAHYYDQVQFSMWCSGFELWDFFQWCPNDTMLQPVDVDQQWQDENLPRLRQFYAEYLDALKDPDDYLAPKRVTIDTPESQRIVSEYDELQEAIENATARRKELLAEMVRIADGKNAEFAGRKLTETKRQGSISYAKALKEYAPDADLEQFRGKASASWGLR